MKCRSVKPLESNNLIEEFEEKINYHFPVSFREFVKINNGGKPSHKVFNTKETNGRVLDSFLSFNKNDKNTVWDYNDWKGTMKDWYDNSEGNVENYVAFADDAFGNLICFDKTNNKIILIDHETLKVEAVATSFEKFIKKLRKIG